MDNNSNGLIKPQLAKLKMDIIISEIIFEYQKIKQSKINNIFQELKNSMIKYTPLKTTSELINSPLNQLMYPNFLVGIKRCINYHLSLNLQKPIRARNFNL